MEDLSLGLAAYRSEHGEYPPSDPEKALQHLRRIYPRYTGEMVKTFSGPDEALHFWLAGPDGAGWSANPDDPFFEDGWRNTRFYEFNADQLVGHKYFPRYVPRGDPYVYFKPDEHGNYAGSAGNCKPIAWKDGRWVNPDSFQIHCPGRDGKYGAGGFLDDSTGYSPERWDDSGNFCDGTLEEAPAER